VSAPYDIAVVVASPFARLSPSALLDRRFGGTIDQRLSTPAAHRATASQSRLNIV
jgi:hypothetical protein